MREKLIELLKKADRYEFEEQKKKGYFSTEAGWKLIADHLIANGVTIQEWIPVTERLPETELVMYEDKFEPGGYGEYYISRPVLVCAEEIGVGRYVKDDNGELWDTDNFIGEPVTHWMPLPTPPKGE